MRKPDYVELTANSSKSHQTEEQKTSSSEPKHSLDSLSSLVVNSPKRTARSPRSPRSETERRISRRGSGTGKRKELGKRRGSLTHQASVIITENVDKARKNPFVKVPFQIIGIVLFIIGAFLFYHYFEGWSLLDSVFFIVVTICTVGYGSPHPTDDRSRAFTIFLMFFGIFVIFSTISKLVNNTIGKINQFFKKSVASTLVEAEALFRLRLMFSMFVIVVEIFVGAIFFTYTEHWTMVQSLYFAVQTSTTVGFGDMELKHNASKIFLCFYIVFSSILLAYAINNFNALRKGRRLLQKKEEMLKQEQTLSFISELNNGEGVGKHEFILEILRHIGTLNNEQDIKPWAEKFDIMDVNRTGKLTKKQLEFFSSQQREESKDEIKRLNHMVPIKRILRKKSMANLKDLFAMDMVFEGDNDSTLEWNRDYFRGNFVVNGHALSRFIRRMSFRSVEMRQEGSQVEYESSSEEDISVDDQEIIKHDSDDIELGDLYKDADFEAFA